MSANGKVSLTSDDWARAELEAEHYEMDNGQTVIKLQKTIDRGRRKFQQFVWLTQEQLQAAARDLRE